MTRRAKILGLLLVPVLLVAIWQWVRPYEWGADPAARATIDFARLRADHSFHWLDLRLTVRDDAEHDLREPVRLLLPGGRELEPAETTLEGGPGKRIEALSLRFWLEPGDLDGRIELKLNDGVLLVRDGDGAPELGERGEDFFRTASW